MEELVVLGAPECEIIDWEFCLEDYQAPALNVIPNALDMGFAAQQVPIQRILWLRNDGLASLHVASIEIVDPSRTAYGDEWDVSLKDLSGPGIAPFEIPASGTQAVLVEFTLKGPSARLEATLRIVSDDPTHPTWDVGLLVLGVGGMCKPALVPAGGVFGTTTVGTALERAFALVNTGTMPCSFRRAVVTDCPAGTDGQPACATPFAGEASTAFSLTGLPAPVVNGLVAGASIPFVVRFDPPAPQVAAALLALEVRDELHGKTIVLPRPGVGGTYAPNLMGEATVAP